MPREGRPPRWSLLIVVTALAALAAPASAQGGHIKAVVGATFSSLRGIDGLDGRTGLIGGLSLALPSSGAFSLQPEFLLTHKGAKGSTNGAEGLKLQYAEVPILLRLTLIRDGSMHPHLYAGPYFGIQIDCRVSGSSGDCDDVPGISTSSVDVGGTLGGGVDFDFGPLVLTGGLRYGFGISKVADFSIGSVEQSAKNGTFAIYTGLGIRFFGGR
jgi:Outer membrane protein beta-barrel domain